MAAAVGFVLLLTAATVVSLVLALWAEREAEKARLNAYAADMAESNSAWRESDAGRARQLTFARPLKTN